MPGQFPLVFDSFYDALAGTEVDAPRNIPRPPTIYYDGAIDGLLSLSELGKINAVVKNLTELGEMQYDPSWQQQWRERYEADRKEARTVLPQERVIEMYPDPDSMFEEDSILALLSKSRELADLIKSKRIPPRGRLYGADVLTSVFRHLKFGYPEAELLPAVNQSIAELRGGMNPASFVAEKPSRASLWRLRLCLH